MSNFKINFKFKELDEIKPFEGKSDLFLHWFGLTDGILWLNVGEYTIYEYSNYARCFFKEDIRYNDYYISRFIEDFSSIFKFISESVPEEIYRIVEDFEENSDKYEVAHMDYDDDEFGEFFINEFYPLVEWYNDRVVDAAHLTSGQMIGFFRYKDKIKILWTTPDNVPNDLDLDGEKIWTSPKGCIEISYDEFVSEVKEFYEKFSVGMDIRVKNAVKRDWVDIKLDKQKLAEENEERKRKFWRDFGYLENPENNTDWDNIKYLIGKMNEKLR